MKVLLLVLAAAVANPIFPSFIRSNNDFAASVYKEVKRFHPGNFLVSPLSARLILTLSQFGSRNETSLELQKVLQLPSCNELILESVATMQNLTQDFVMQLLNKVYIRKKYSLREDFLKTAGMFGAETEEIDFEQREKAAQTMNHWVMEKTDGKIRDLIGAGILSNETRLVLLNALTFKANWSSPFHFFATMDKGFHTPNGTVQVEMMHIFEERFKYYEREDLGGKFLELPFVGDDISMTLVLTEDLDRLEKNMEEVFRRPENVSEGVFNVGLPKFEMESRIEFKPILQNLGVKLAFEDGKADFSGIAGEKGELFIDDVVQKTYIDVNEDGIEAAAATYVVKIVNRNGDSARNFILDRPFLFLVKMQDLVLFCGRVMKP